MNWLTWPHRSSAALDYSPFRTEPFQLLLLVSGTIYPSTSLLHLHCFYSGHASSQDSSFYYPVFPIPVPDRVQCSCSDTFILDTLIIHVTYLLTYLHDCSMWSYINELLLKTYGSNQEADTKRMSASRCAELMVIAIANRLSEVWIASHPVLLFTYCMQFIPSVSSRLVLHHVFLCSHCSYFTSTAHFIYHTLWPCVS